MKRNTVVGFLVIVMLLIAGCDKNAINYDKEYEKQKEQISQLLPLIFLNIVQTQSRKYGRFQMVIVLYFQW